MYVKILTRLQKKKTRRQKIKQKQIINRSAATKVVDISDYILNEKQNINEPNLLYRTQNTSDNTH